MSGAGTAFDQLLAALRGRSCEVRDWWPVIALANRTLLTPTLYSTIASASALERLPRDEAAYLEFIARSNCDRNLRLRRQLREAVATLNHLGIEPMLLKGTIPLFGAERDPLPCRITSDLDLVVEAEELEVARASLQALGYSSMTGRDLVRPEDAAIIDLRSNRQPPGLDPPGLVGRARLRARVPSPQSQCLHLFVHDLFKAGDYWRGALDLRHLHDLAELAKRESLNWERMRGFMRSSRSRNAFDTQLLALNHLFGVPVPPELIRRLNVRLQHGRRLFPARHPVLGAPLRLAGNLSWGVWRAVQVDDLGRGGPAELVRRGFRVLFSRRAKI